MNSGVRPKGPAFKTLKIIGLTGGIAAGKSAVARILESEGFPVIDADGIARTLTAPGGRAADSVLKRFGTLDRQQLRELIFSDPSAKKDLEALLHPLIRAETAALIETWVASRPGLKTIFYEAALLIETGTAQDLDGLWIVTAPEEVRIQRLKARDKITTELATKILRSQMSDDERFRTVPSAVRIENAGTPEDLRHHLRALISGLR